MTRENNGFTHEDGVTLKEFFLAKCSMCEHNQETKFDAMELALKLAREQLEFRLEGMNHVQREIRDLKTSYITRVEHEALVEQIQDLKESRAELRGKASQSSVFVSYLLVALSLTISLIAMLK